MGKDQSKIKFSTTDPLKRVKHPQKTRLNGRKNPHLSTSGAEYILQRASEDVMIDNIAIPSTAHQCAFYGTNK